ncbi:glycerol ethanol, ferric requiring protein [Coemansia spiralis]|uniref:Chloride channel protein n=2 Tax=Coemansia TaxID=4863 RepID=A0A9W8G1X1_9FUNG|nr:chloride channel [Coemansia spiralis]KAJ1987667.1 glycerol ethanol, ferric requiring protein [Coemansia umbellata]KAJ2618874.1 glycerol ethanol, ferric requiring protein [Coemansia sp. RSA 1358]KAJ2671002.1 glycerol ethanol, ferric requiring protein [Coemansia spiralis]
MSSTRFDEFETVDWVSEGAKERRRQKQHNHTLLSQLDSLVPWLVVILTGVLIGLNTACISIVTEWLSDLKLGVCSQMWWLNAKFCCWPDTTNCGYLAWDQLLVGHSVFVVRWLVFVLAGTGFASLCAWLVNVHAPQAAGSGLPEIKAILNGFTLGRGFLGMRTLVLKTVGLALAVASGLSVGKEGPAVHMGCCVGAVVLSWFGRGSSPHLYRETVSASAAAGVAVAFGAPIGGVLFSLEDLSSHFPRRTLWRSFLCALVATVSLQAMNPFRTGKLVLFQASYDRDWHFFEVVFFVLIGVFGGVFGGLCIKANLWVAARRRAYMSKVGPIREVALLALGTTLVTYLNRFTREDMGELLAALLQECTPLSTHHVCGEPVVWALFWATVIRAVGTVTAYGCRVPCGIFVPSMAIGASFGRMLGTLVLELHHRGFFTRYCPPDTVCITPATYAFLGAAAAMSGVTKVTVAVVVIMYELTGALNFVVPVMIVVMVARVVGDVFIEGGISEQLIRLNGVPFLEDEEEDHVDIVVSEIATEATVCVDGMRVEELDSVLSLSVHGYPVVDEQMRVMGYVRRERLLRESNVSGAAVRFSGPASLAHLVESPVTVRPSVAVETAVEIFRKLGPRVLLVTTSDSVLVGLVTRKDIVRVTRH